MPKAEAEANRRAAEQYRGAAPIIGSLVAAGFKTKEQIDQVLAREQRAREAGIDIDSLIQSVSPRAVAEETVLTTQSVEATVKKVLTEHEAASASRIAEREHQSARQRVTDMADGLAKKIAGGKDPLVARAIVNEILRSDDNHMLYEADHPLHDRVFRPLSEVEFKDRIEKKAMEVWTSMTGQQLAEIGNGAGKRTDASPQPGGSGAPQTAKADLPFKRQPMEVKRAFAEEALRKMQNSAGGQAMSSV